TTKVVCQLRLSRLSTSGVLPARERTYGRGGHPKRSKMKKQKGFSLIELLIVVAIILIIAAIAIPNLLRSRMAANEASAVGSIRTINTSEVTYASTYGAGYAATLAALASPASGACTATAAQACLIDAVLGGGTKS